VIVYYCQIKDNERIDFGRDFLKKDNDVQYGRLEQEEYRRRIERIE